jgi:cysteinyl-tRNA synthetase
MNNPKPKAQNPKASGTRNSGLETPIHLYNTASRSVEEFIPIKQGQVGLYTCGPTVYDYAHIGNLRTYIFEDILKRVLLYNGLQIKHVMNVTDVGHLTSDADEGEDKMEKGAARTGQTVWDVAKFYEQQFFNDLKELNILLPDVIAKATNEIAAQQQLIQKLFDKGFAYQTKEAIYFDVSKFPQYWEFSRQKLEEKQVAVRQEVHEDLEKRHPADFALWLFTVGEHANHTMRWPSPWGEGFPGWHIECSAISMKYLGEEFDIHTGGVDHIGTHHPDEIAQSKAATGKNFAHYWLHGEFLNISGNKMSKSKENFYRLQTIIDHGFTPLDYRFMCLNWHYRSVLDFSWEAMDEAKNSYRHLKQEVVHLGEETGDVSEYWERQFHVFINSDLGTPNAMSVVWNLLNDRSIDNKVKKATINKFDQVLSLGLAEAKNSSLDDKEKELIDQRQQARAAKDWAKADELRAELAGRGVEIEDTANGSKWTKIT